MSRTIPQIIDTLGITALADELGHKWPTTVQGWKSRGVIPLKHIPAVIDASKRLGKPTTKEELVDAMMRAA